MVHSRFLCRIILKLNSTLFLFNCAAVLNHFFFQLSVDGDWSEWTEWTLCSQVCDGGEQTRYRECNNPAPLHGGKDCQGNKRDSRTCNYFKCPGETMVETLLEDFVLAGLVLTGIFRL